jgi:GT2 family glycosyltransferase
MLKPSEAAGARAHAHGCGEPGSERPRAEGKFLYVGHEKIWVRGVTYGTFRPASDGEEFRRDIVDRDFTQIATNGLNAIRTYTVPPRWLLDAAAQHGLWVMVGLPWEQHVTFLDDPERARSIEARVRADIQACACHPAVLCYAIGNEIPASVVRWHGRRRIERYIMRLYRAAKAEDPGALVTYVNYPTTEYLQLPFLDLVCFNVYLESPERLEAYLARLHNVAGDRPLVMAEIGLDSRRHGEETQARVVDWQIRTAFAAGCAGAFIFAWTDEWHRGGHDVEDWDFGLATRDRRPKRALATVLRAFADVPFPRDRPWPRISVVVCSYNGARTLRDCFDGLIRLEYPNFEVIVVNDGSHDQTASITREYAFRLISTQNRGLSSARNTGLKAATGEIVAYLDDDAWPDPHWLSYLADAFLRTAHAGVGGPNMPPPGDGLVADCVGNAPGGPTHVLLSDREAEHIPGCNMAFRKTALEAIGGFDPRFRMAGDDLDVCWRLQEQGWTLGFSPAAVVWHHRRNSVRAFWRQQLGYGKAEALLETKWPEKYNAAGHLAWAGRLYGRGLAYMLSRRARIYHGTWGAAPFQALYEPTPGLLALLPLMPEWYLVIAGLGALSAIGILWAPLLWALPLLTLAAGATLAQAGLSAARASFANPPRSLVARARLYGLTALLSLLQPLARLWGRLRFGLTPWRERGVAGLAFPWLATCSIWSEQWQAPTQWLRFAESAVRVQGAVVLRGSEYDRWDLEARVGTLGAVRLLMATEEHGAGRQLLRFHAWPRGSPCWLALMLGSATLALGAALGQAWAAASLLGGVAVSVAGRAVLTCAGAMAAVRRGLDAVGIRAGRPPTWTHRWPG